MKKIKIYPCVENPTTDYIRRQFGIEDERIYGWEFVLTEDNPQYLLVTEHIYYCKSNLQIFKKMIKRYPEAIRIFRTGECVSPDFNMFDYAIVFDRDLKNNDRVCRIPFNRFFKDSLLVNQSDIRYEEKINNGLRFCNFMYSNANAHPNRDKLFYTISDYKKVDSIGKHLNNTGTKSTRYDTDWRKLSIELREPYKFSIASENACFKGYVSEKLISCLQAGTLAIYWGDPSIGEDFNTKSFINCNEYASFEDVVKRIKEIDNDDDLWLKIVTEPWQTEEQKKRMEEADEEYITFIKKIFNAESKIALRRPEGTFTEYYLKWALDKQSSNRMDELFNLAKKILKRK